MSSKKPKSESKKERCFLDANFAASVLRLICSFFTLKERAHALEVTCKHFKAASRHPSSFAGIILLDVTRITSASRLDEFCRRYSSPRLQAIQYIDDADDDVDPSPQLAALSAAFGSSLQSLQIVYSNDEVKWSPVGFVDLFMISRMTNLRIIQIGALSIESLSLLENLKSLEGLTCQTELVNFFDVASHTKIIQQLKFLVVTFAPDGDGTWVVYNPVDKTTPVTQSRDIRATKEAAHELPKLWGLIIDAPSSLTTDLELPSWVLKENPRLKPPWARQMCPNLERCFRSQTYSLKRAPADRFFPFAKFLHYGCC